MWYATAPRKTASFFVFVVRTCERHLLAVVGAACLLHILFRSARFGVREDPFIPYTPTYLSPPSTMKIFCVASFAMIATVAKTATAEYRNEIVVRCAKLIGPPACHPQNSDGMMTLLLSVGRCVRATFRPSFRCGCCVVPDSRLTG